MFKSLIVAGALGVCSGAWAAAPAGADPNDPEVALARMLTGVIHILDNGSLDLAAKETRIDKLVQPVFDFDFMAYLTLGRQRWNGMSPEERRRFTRLFVTRLKDSYRDKLSLYSGQRVLYETAKRNGTRIEIPTKVTSEDEAVDVVYKMYEKRRRTWRIYDVVVEGVSLVKTYRSQFAEILARGSVADLLAKLAEPVGAEAPAQP